MHIKNKQSSPENQFVDPEKLTLRVSRFDNEFDKVPKPENVCLGDLIGTHELRAKKKGGACFSAATFDGGREEEDAREVTAIIQDFDNRTDSQRADIFALADGYAFAWYTTFRHLSDEKNHTGHGFRMLFPITRHLDAQTELKPAMKMLSLKLGSQDDQATHQANRIWYVPAAPKARIGQAEHGFHKGKRVDVDELLGSIDLEQIPLGLPEKATGKPFHTPRPGSVSFQTVLEFFEIDLPVGGVMRCPFQDHEDNDPSFRRDSEESWLCTCGVDGTTAAGGSDKFIYRMFDGPRDFKCRDAWRVWHTVWSLVRELGGAPPAKGYLTENRTDTGHAFMLKEFTGGNLRYVHPWKTWIRWSGAYWEECVNGEEYEEVGKLVKYLHSLTSNILDDDKRKKFAAANLSLENVKKQESTLKMAQHMMAEDVDNLDTHQMLFNAGGRTFDLETGEVRDPSPEDLLTQTVHTTYDPDATCKTWLETLDQLFPNNKQIIYFLQRAAGYSLTGSVVEQCMMILIGEGSNGKTTFLEALRRALGDYGRKVSAQTFLAKRGEPIPVDLATLRGKRYAVAVEPEMGKTFAESLVKEVTGGDTINARRLFQMPFEFKPQFKLWLATNRLPTIKGTDDGIWRRLRVIPFNVTIPKDKQDHKLEQKLRWEAPGILNWMLEGARMWREDGLDEPEEVIEATAAYREEQDRVGAFLQEMCVRDVDATCKAGALYAAYSDWCKDVSEYPMQGKDFKPELIRRGLEQVTRQGGKVWKGLGLKVKDQIELLPDNGEQTCPGDPR